MQGTKKNGTGFTKLMGTTQKIVFSLKKRDKEVIGVGKFKRVCQGE